MTGRGHQMIHSDAFAAELEAMGLDQSIFGPHLPAPIFQALVPRKAGVFDEHAHTFGTGDEPATFARASDGLYRNSAGAWAIASAGAIRAEHSAAGAFLGYLFEPASTNEFLNSAAPVTQNIALGTGTFTLSVHGSGSVTSANGTGTASGHGAATEGSHVTLVVSGAGTFSFTVAGGPPTYVQVEEQPVPTSQIITQGTAETRAIDTLSWAALPAELDQSQGTIILDFIPRWDRADVPGGGSPLVSFGSGVQPLYFNHGGGATVWQIAASDGVAFPVVSPDTEPVNGTWTRAALRWGSSTFTSMVWNEVDNAWKSSIVAAYDGSFTTTNLRICQAVSIPLLVKNIAIWNRDIGLANIERCFTPQI